ncbi:MAG: DUF1461 domain-containing protein [Chloroflexi bacterium]|nr:DUF1461 domain-containing protein [Chloroflexota bacterium]
MNTPTPHPDSSLSERNTAPPDILPRFVLQMLQGLIVLTLPVVLILGSVRLVMSEAFLWLEYNRPGFPEDPYGFTTEDRLEYGPYGVRYLVEERDISYLAELEIGGKPAFNRDELRHMEDVQDVTQAALRVLLLGTALLAIGFIPLARQPRLRPRLRQALRWGGWLTFGVFMITTAVMLVSWGFFFEAFHDVFFEAGTWQFYKSDTLIRLYPEQFWFDAALSIGLLASLGAGLCVAIPWYWECRLARQAATPSDADTDPAYPVEAT